MQPDPEYLRQHYASLADEALLEIDRDDLVEVARKVYDAEVSRRALDQTESAMFDDHSEMVHEPIPSSESPDWLDDAAEVYSVYDRGPQSTDALSAAVASLQAAGIPSHVELIDATEDRIPQPSQRYRLLVPAKLNLQAMSTLERDFSNQDFEDLWRVQLEGCSDREFLASAPEVVFPSLFDRVERVRRCYREEALRRGVRVDAPRRG